MAVDKNKIVAEATRFVQKGQYDKALKAYDKILAEDRKEVRTLLKVGEIQQKKGDQAAAAATFNQVAEIYGEQGFFLKAVAVYKQIAKLTPDDVRVNEKLAGLYQQLGLVNDSTSQLQAVAAAYEKAGDQGRHLDVLRRLLDLDPENVVTCQRLGDLYAKANRSDEALELYRRAAAHLRENRRGDEYVKLAERILSITPGDTALARELAREYLARGDTKKALGKLQLCHGADKQDAETLRLMAQAFRDLGQTSKTVAVYRALAHVYAERGRREDAAATWRLVQEILPDDPEAAEELAASSPPVPRPPTPPPTVPVVARPPPAPAPAASAGSGSRVLTEADVYLKYGLQRKALEHIQKFLETEPQNPDALERVRDISEALGERRAATEAAERVVNALRGRGDVDRLSGAVERLRQLDPDRAKALTDSFATPLHDLAAPDPGSPFILPPDDDGPRSMSGPEGPTPVLDDESPSAIAAYEGIPVDLAPPPAARSEEADDGEPPIDVDVDVLDVEVLDVEVVEPVDAELEEVEFYERQGLMEEALLAVQELASAHPDHPAVAPVLARIEKAAAAQAAEPEVPSPGGGAGVNHRGIDEIGSTVTTGIFDLGAELAAELGSEPTPTPAGDAGYSVAEVFDQFKRGLARTVRPDDAATKYDLGIAFQEMGMLDEALEQFRSALAGGDRTREVDILTMLGSCLGLKGSHAEAIEAYRQALGSEFLTGEAAKATHFELGAAHEALGEPAQALWYFQWVALNDPGYRGVAERVARLGGGPGEPPTAGAAANVRKR